jgi:gas vesicle protein
MGIVDSKILLRSRRRYQERKRTMSNECVNTNKVAALMVGALLGAGVALLFAPQSGRKTRRDIRQFTERVENKAEAARLELQHSIDNIIEDVEERLRDGLAGGMNWTNSKIAELQQALNSVRKSIAGEIDKIQST